MESFEETIDRIKHIMLDFQVGDLDRSIHCAKANFLVAIGLMVSTEFLGGLVSGTLGLKKGRDLVKRRFEEGFKRLGDPYAELLERQKGGVPSIYENVRCGLVHQYLPSETEGVYAGETAGAGIVLNQDGQFRIMTHAYIRDLRIAVERLLEELETNERLLEQCQKALSQVDDLA